MGFLHLEFNIQITTTVLAVRLQKNTHSKQTQFATKATGYCCNFKV